MRQHHKRPKEGPWLPLNTSAGQSCMWGPLQQGPQHPAAFVTPAKEAGQGTQTQEMSPGCNFTAFWQTRGWHRAPQALPCKDPLPAVEKGSRERVTPLARSTGPFKSSFCPVLHPLQEFLELRHRASSQWPSQLQQTPVLTAVGLSSTARWLLFSLAGT